MNEPADDRRAIRTRARADEVLDQVGILDNPYLLSLQDGSTSLTCFRLTQRQFYVAVSFFSRPMAAMLARIPDPRARLDILHNVVEEHGAFSEDEFHATTFQAVLERLGCETRRVRKQPFEIRDHMCSLCRRPRQEAAGFRRPLAGVRGNRT
ncbi:MAG: iron-containing redox enzyme family protein [Planctomycetales bacterium]